MTYLGENMMIVLTLLAAFFAVCMVLGALIGFVQGSKDVADAWRDPK